MKKITRTIYIAEDGAEFYDEQKCKTYEDDGCVELEPIPKHCTHVILTEINLAWMLSGDGDCCYATASKMSNISAGSRDHPKWATHLVYFGK